MQFGVSWLKLNCIKLISLFWPNTKFIWSISESKLKCRVFFEFIFVDTFDSDYLKSILNFGSSKRREKPHLYRFMHYLLLFCNFLSHKILNIISNLKLFTRPSLEGSCRLLDYFFCAWLRQTACSAKPFQNNSRQSKVYAFLHY